MIGHAGPRRFAGHFGVARRQFADGHWTTFDLTRDGMVVVGHATQGLPQVELELHRDEIVRQRNMHDGIVLVEPHVRYVPERRNPGSSP